LTKLGNPDAVADRTLEVFEVASGVTRVRLDCREFTCRCPITGQPDWASIDVEYVPNGLAVETKSMKLYLETFREEGIFHEALADVIAGDVHEATNARHVRVTVHFNARGGIALDAVAERGDPPARER
jgi:7-cyano-7-deazaguanine reductase